jgi:hypothetical protein
MKPDLQFSVLCDEVRREDNGKLMLIGLFEMIGGPEYPLVYPGMAVINRWCNGLGDFTQRVRLMDSENKVLVETLDSPLQLTDMRATVTAVSLLRNIVFPKPGRYSVEILLDGDLKQRFALGASLVRPIEIHGAGDGWTPPTAPPAG